MHAADAAPAWAILEASGGPSFTAEAVAGGSFGCNATAAVASATVLGVRVALLAGPTPHPVLEASLDLSDYLDKGDDWSGASRLAGGASVGALAAVDVDSEGGDELIVARNERFGSATVVALRPSADCSTLEVVAATGRGVKLAALAALAPMPSGEVAALAAAPSGLEPDVYVLARNGKGFDSDSTYTVQIPNPNHDSDGNPDGNGHQLGGSSTREWAAMAPLPSPGGTFSRAALALADGRVFSVDTSGGGEVLAAGSAGGAVVALAVGDWLDTGAQVRRPDGVKLQNRIGPFDRGRCV